MSDIIITKPEQILLPFAAREYIDTRRARRILGVSFPTLTRLAKNGLVDWLDGGKDSWKRIRYQSVVDFCDRVREQHKIPERRPKLSNPHLRYRDEDLLPFPLSDTITAKHALELLGLTHRRSMVRLIEEGRFEGYQLVAQSEWRVSRSSLLVYLDKRRARVQPGDPAAYKIPTVSVHF
jgi:hypothetical protein